VKQYIRSLFPTDFFANNAHFRALILGLLYLGTLLAQLYTFEDFKGVIVGFGIPGGATVANILSWLMPGLTLLALPVLISMRLNEKLYIISRTAVVAVPLLWLVIGIWCNLTGNVGSAGIFGATLEIATGIWQIAFALLWLWAAVLVVRELPRRP
jgi:hypothetical protein